MKIALLYLPALNCLCRARLSVGWWSRGESLDAALSLRLGPQALGKGLGSREGTQSLLVPLSTPNPTFS